MTTVTRTGTAAMAAAKASTTATSKSQYAYPGEKKKQQAAARKRRVRELKAYIERTLTLSRTFHSMALRADAELAELEEQWSQNSPREDTGAASQH